MNMINIEAESWNRFLTRNLKVVPEIMGARHEFEMFDKFISIKLPNLDDISEGPLENDRGNISSYQEIEGKEIPRLVSIFSVDVCVKLSQKVKIPEQVLCRHPNAYDVLTSEKRQQLNLLSENYGVVAERAFEQWLRILRWKTNNSLIGRPQVNGFQSGWSTHLTECTTGHPFWVQGVQIKIMRDDPVTAKDWLDTAQALKMQLSSPVYYDLIFDAEEHLRLGDLQRAVVDAAVACESFIRSKVMERLPIELQDGIKSYIDEVNIRPFVSKILPGFLDDEQKVIFKKIQSILHQLFDARNTILHSGRKHDLSLDECKKYIKVAKQLISIW